MNTIISFVIFRFLKIKKYEYRFKTWRLFRNYEANTK
jgi:hypothetical protein